MPNLETTLILVTLALSVIVAVVVVKIGISFNVNDYMNERRKRGKDRLVMLCPHAISRVDGDKLMIESLMTSPSGTLSWVCSRCRTMTHDQGAVERTMKDYADDPKLLLDKEKLFQKHARKYYRL